MKHGFEDGGPGEGAFDPLAGASRSSPVPSGHFWFTMHVDDQTPLRRGGAVIEHTGRAPGSAEAI